MLNLDKDRLYILACSCGPDSMALFDMLRKEGYNFKVAFVNYHTRTNSDEEEVILSGYCKKHNIEMEKLDAYYNKEKNGNFEAWARDVRYEFFKDVTLKFNAYATLVAHHNDDLIETYILQKQRNLMLPYYGLNTSNVIKDTLILRPLLRLRKKDLLEYCKENEVPYSIDYTNFDETHARNVVRHKIVEVLTEMERDDILAEIAELNSEREEEIYRARQLVNGNRLKIINLLAESDEVQYFVVYNFLNQLENVGLTAGWIKEIIKLCNSNKSNVVIQVNKDYVLCKEYDELALYQNSILEFEGYEYELKEPGAMHCKYFDLYFESETPNRNIVASDYPLIIRTFKHGDCYEIEGHQHEVRRLFIDWKMPLALRKYWPLFINKDGKIIYIPRYSSSYKEPLNSNLRIHIKL